MGFQRPIKETKRLIRTADKAYRESVRNGVDRVYDDVMHFCEDTEKPRSGQVSRPPSAALLRVWNLEIEKRTASVSKKAGSKNLLGYIEKLLQPIDAAVCQLPKMNDPAIDQVSESWWVEFSRFHDLAGEALRNIVKLMETRQPNVGFPSIGWGKAGTLMVKLVSRLGLRNELCF